MTRGHITRIILVAAGAAAMIWLIFLTPSKKPIAEPSIRRGISIIGDSPLGPMITIKVKEFEQPIWVLGNQIIGDAHEEWLDVFSKIKAPYLLSFDQYKELVTADFLEMTGCTNEALFNGSMSLHRDALSKREPLKSSVLCATYLECQNGEFLLITEYGGEFLTRPFRHIENNLKTLVLLRRENGQWKQESFNLMARFGIDLIPWSDRDELLALGQARDAVVSGGALRAK